ncbi:hypothetical protein PR048_026598 [Dryococelus australis]|uniref:Prolactin receptor n=1 Tax=Dryococelus australis TaxID=614101 RepID=A0ABQ9GLU5_9NEOP|nr:hypothetical protein PR048_026598 [Dryococelus australis]
MEQRRNKGEEETEDPEKSRRPSSSSATIPKCENLGMAQPGTKPGSPWWEASRLTAQPPLNSLNQRARQHTSTPSTSQRLGTWKCIRRHCKAEPNVFPTPASFRDGQKDGSWDPIRVGETGYPRENPQTSGIVRNDFHLPWWEASRLTFPLAFVGGEQANISTSLGGRRAG